MVPKRCMDNVFIFPASLEEISTDLGMASFEFMVGRFTDIMEQSASPREIRVEPHHFGHKPRKERNLDAVPKDVLGIAGSEVEPTQHVDHTLVETLDINLLRCLFTLPPDKGFHFLFCCCDHFFDPSWVNPPIGD
jgi:hypothetical protein